MAGVMAAPPQIDDLHDWFVALTQPTALTELAVLAGCVVLAWGLVWLARRSAGVPDPNSIWFGRRIIDGVMFPLLLLCAGYVAREALAHRIPMAVFRIALPVLVSLATIRLGVKVLQVAFKAAPLVRALERTISWLAWIAMVLWVSGLLPLVIDELDQITWKVGGSRISVTTMIAGALTAGAVLLVTLWISAAIEGRLLRKATGSELSVRIAISNAIRALLMFVGLLVALSAVGIDLTTLSVLGGAIGVGIGLGLQQLAANYVSGFVILAERSVRIGDNVRVDTFEGRITNINARYTLIRSTSGRESIVPNAMMTAQRVENLSLADTRVWLSTVVSVGYESDVDLVMRLLVDAAARCPRVLRDPAPAAALSAFGADGLEFTVGFWISDPENGQLGLRSQINLAILRSLREHHIDIPYPQRVVHVKPT
ncbi:mechanosensitive ion channel domain-containing protein [Polaromonas sp. C04]|uniref:mechanosensitive ion channel family protein n=1 Tax=Polaromonas sp. C04 TaxID=1945857 RepID=UPI00098562AC|nr:mechanosensitive ion channel domain-containing protein [Polaromonas sp. C04]OOG56149.1 mechanosensitive ion channel protein [Polaromonas sp. C04]